MEPRIPVRRGLPWCGGLAVPFLQRTVPARSPCAQREGIDALGERETVLAGVDQREPLQVQMLQGRTHRRGDAGAVGELDLEAQPTRAAGHRQVQLSAGVQRPETALLVAGTEGRGDRGDGEVLLGGPDLGVAGQVRPVSQAEQGVQQTWVGDADLG